VSADGGRAFVRLVALISVITCGAAATMSRGEIATHPYVEAVMVDGAGLGLTEEVAGYGSDVEALIDRVVAGSTR
jgi:hypothetical protein